MLTLKKIELRNFLSVGNVVQSVQLNKAGMTLVLGENQDLGGNGSRNGVGKTSLLNAISYALYGKALSSIKRNNLINRINGKNMAVSIEFTVGTHSYRIERGRSPNFFRYLVDDQTVNAPDTDEAQGENSETQKTIDTVLGMTHTMFCNIVALNTYTIPFLSQGAGKQRELIEELLLITMLSTKAERLKELIRNTKIAYDQEEVRLKTIKSSNDRIQTTLDQLLTRMVQWQDDHDDKISQLYVSVDSLEKLDIDAEIATHRTLADLKTYRQALADEQRLLLGKNRHMSQLQAQLMKVAENHATANHSECPMCRQGLAEHIHASIIADLEAQLVTLDGQIGPLQTEIDRHQTDVALLQAAIAGIPVADPFHKSLEDAYNHRNSVVHLRQEIERMENEVNPYLAQQDSLNTTLQQICHNVLNDLATLKEHQEFLLKLLTNKDSFIRKKIIDQNLAYLNVRLQDYLTKLGLPHQVKFTNDLSVEISLLGQDLDFHNLSRGESTRVILALSWAFRDVWESNNQPCNLMFIDEMLDNGLDPVGTEKSLELLKSFSRDRNKNILLISHREELASRVGNILLVVKEGGFTYFDWEGYSI
jgi:DNA repair exonuclease SbcCD ATPase subunit